MGAGTGNWRCITSSSSGMMLAAGNHSGIIYFIGLKCNMLQVTIKWMLGYISTSTDLGNTWVVRTGAGRRNWQSIASSSDGLKLAAAAYIGNSSYIQNSYFLLLMKLTLCVKDIYGPLLMVEQRGRSG